MANQLIKDIANQSDSFAKLASKKDISSARISEEIRRSAVHLARIVADTAHSFNELIADFTYDLKKAPGIIWVRDGDEMYAHRNINQPPQIVEEHKEPLIEKMVEIKSSEGLGMNKETIKKIAEQAEEFEKVAAGKDKPRGEFIFPADHPKVKDNKGHLPLNTEGRGRNALARANQFSKAPKWYKGTLQEFINTVVRAVHKKYPGIEISDKAKKPGKG